MQIIHSKQPVALMLEVSGHYDRHVCCQTARPLEDTEFVPVVCGQHFVGFSDDFLCRYGFGREILTYIGKRIPHPDKEEVVDGGGVTRSNLIYYM